jgi:hypothetical protein
MGQQRFTPEFKDEAVRQVTEKGHSVPEVAVAGLAIMDPVSELAFLADRRRDEAEAIHRRTDYWGFERS